MKPKEVQKQFNPHVQDKMPHCVWMTGNPPKAAKNQNSETVVESPEKGSEEITITIELTLSQVIGIVLIISSIIDLLTNY
jgi:hypothetical protein